VLIETLRSLRTRLIHFRRGKRWEKYRKLGMQLGKDINLPDSTWIDLSHCFLISIGDKCGFGEGCAILAHDAMPNEYIDATKVGRVKIHESCHFGMRTVILPGVEIGPRAVVGSNSVVAGDIPPDSVAVGNPAKVICSLDDYLKKHCEQLKRNPNFQYKKYSVQYLTSQRKQEMLEKLATTSGYITGGYTALEEGCVCLRT
jgi:maltose O-acetyltransferase